MLDHHVYYNIFYIQFCQCCMRYIILVYGIPYSLCLFSFDSYTYCINSRQRGVNISANIIWFRFLGISAIFSIIFSHKVFFYNLFVVLVSGELLKVITPSPRLILSCIFKYKYTNIYLYTCSRYRYYIDKSQIWLLVVVRQFVYTIYI